jgi:hypothetical protein
MLTGFIAATFWRPEITADDPPLAHWLARLGERNALGDGHGSKTEAETGDEYG